MENMSLPKSWKKINNKVYDHIGVVNDDFIKCLGSYVVKEKGKIVALSFYDYTKHKKRGYFSFHYILLKHFLFFFAT